MEVNQPYFKNLFRFVSCRIEQILLYNSCQVQSAFSTLERALVIYLDVITSDITARSQPTDLVKKYVVTKHTSKKQNKKSF